MAKRTLGDHQLAEDAAQEAWVRISRQLDEGVQPEFEQSWVLTFARREALRIAERRRKPHPLPEEQAAPPDYEPRIETEEERNRLREAIDRLPPEDRDIIRLKYLEQLSPADLRDHLGLQSRNGVSRRLRRATDRLRRLVRDDD